MVMTQYGDPIDRIIYVDEKFGMATVALTPANRRKPVERTYFLHQLRADGGIKEIIESAEKRRS